MKIWTSAKGLDSHNWEITEQIGVGGPYNARWIKEWGYLSPRQFWDISSSLDLEGPGLTEWMLEREKKKWGDKSRNILKKELRRIGKLSSKGNMRCF